MPTIVFSDSDGVDREVEIGADPVLIGRATECRVQTQDAMVSRRHARIFWDNGYWIEDLGSSNGVHVGGERVQRAPLRPGDEARCGSLVLRLVAAMRNTPPPPAAPPPAAYAAPPPADFGAPPAYVPPPLPAAPPPYEAPPPADARLNGPTAPSPIAAAELAAERARRTQAEEAVLLAEQRAATAENKLYEFQSQVGELTVRAQAAEQQAQAATARLQEVESTSRDGDKWRRQVEQLKADLRRLRGGADAAEPAPAPAAAPAAGDGADVTAVTAERDRLKQRVADLEAEVARLEGDHTTRTSPAEAAEAAPTPQTAQQTAQLQRKVDQLSAEIRRLRGGQPAPAVDESAGQKVAELEAKVAQLQQERDAAVGRADAAGQASSAAGDEKTNEIAKLKRLLEQLTAENRRMKQGAAEPVKDDPRIAELTARVAQVEQERDAAVKRAAQPPPAAPPPLAAPPAAAKAGLDPGAADAINTLNDALSDLRGSLRACNDEVGVLGVEAPGDSVTAMKEALTAATDQLEGARGGLREVKRVLGLP